MQVIFSANPEEVRQQISAGYYIDEIQAERFEKDRYFKDTVTLHCLIVRSTSSKVWIIFQ